jgi:hypothetical protein
MSRAVIRTLSLCFFSAHATTPFLAQSVTQAVPAPAPVAYVYVATSKGINLYNAASNGRLTLVPVRPSRRRA